MDSIPRNNAYYIKTKASEIDKYDNGPWSMQCYYLDKEENQEVKIGRSKDMDITLDYPLISNHHATLIRKHKGWFIYDNNSRNGVFLNDCLIFPRRLYPLMKQDIFKLGTSAGGLTFVFDKHECHPAESCSYNSSVNGNLMPLMNPPLNANQLALLYDKVLKLESEKIDIKRQNSQLEKNLDSVELKLKKQRKLNEEYKKKTQERNDFKKKLLKNIKEKEVCINQLKIENAKLQDDIEKYHEKLFKTNEELNAAKSRLLDENAAIRLQNDEMTSQVESLEAKLSLALVSITKIEQEYVSKFDEHRMTVQQAQQEAFKDMQSHVNRLMEMELNCSICQDVFIEPLTLGCAHTFCKYCIYAWKQTKRECPICRQEIRIETKNLLIENFLDKIIVSYFPGDVKKSRDAIKRDRGILLRVNELDLD